MMGEHVPFRLLFEESPDVLLVLLPDAPRYTIVAATRARLLATHTTTDQIGRGLFELFPDNPDDPAATGTTNLRASLQRVLETRAPDTMAVQKYDIRGPDGSFEVKHWSPKNIPVLSATGEILYILHRVEDVTDLVKASELGEELRDRTREMEREVVRRSQELARANNELREANTKLTSLDALKTQFFANISHEFRTPLTLILGPMEDALADPSRALQGESLETVHRSALRLLRLVNNLLEFSRIEAGRQRASFEPTDLARATASVASSFQSLLESAGLKLTVDCPPLSEPIHVDTAQWEKVVLNLVSNAFKFTFTGEIAIALRERSDHVELSVRDTGTGIPDVELPRIFERFHRVEGARGRSFEGTGIGLALVHEIVRLHGGSVRVESTVGQGSTFFVSLPKGTAHLPQDRLAEVEVAGTADAAPFLLEASQWDTPPEVEPSPPDLETRVLVADDNTDMREYLTRLLRRHWSVEAVADGEAALASAVARPPSLVLSDGMMPKMDGFTLLRELRANPITKTVPVILLSARAGEDAVIEGLETGADDYLVKPFSARELVSRVRTHLEMANARNAAVRLANELAETRASLLADLERKNDELAAFSYAVSHDLRAPLRSVSGFAEALFEDCAETLGAQGHEHLQRIRDASKRMEELIDALLELSSVGRAELRLEPTNVSAMVSDVVGRLRLASPGRDVAVRIQDDVVAEVDPRLFRILLENLLGNAWKFTSKAARAEIEFGRVADTFFVRDNGAGFNPAYAKRLFAPFQRLHPHEDFPGTGIGLSTVQRIVHRHGGRVWAEGAPGHGAKFLWTVSRSEHA